MKKILTITFLTFLSQIIFSQTQIGQSIFGIYESNSCGKQIALSADGTRMVLGFSGLDYSPGAIDSGFVRVYELNNSVWEQIGSDIEGDDLDVGTGFAVSISADGNRIAFSAPYRHNEDVFGVVRIMEYNGNEWIQLGNHLSSDDITGSTPNFGFDLSLSFDGNSIAIGGPTYSKGIVYTYKYNGGEWILTGELFRHEDFERFGTGVLFSKNGTRVAIADRHFVRVFDYIDEAWIQIGNSISDYNGIMTSITTNMDGTRIVTADPNFNFPKGSVKVFELEDTTWSQIGETIEPFATNGYFGYSTSLSADGNTLVIGEPNNNLVSIYNYINENWILYEETISGESGDEFGAKVSLSSDGSILAIGSPSNDEVADFSGVTRVFKLNQNSSSIQTISSCGPFQVEGTPDITWSETGLYHYTLPNYQGADSLVFVNLTIESINTSIINSDTSLVVELENANYQWLDCNDNYSIIDGANEQTLIGVGSGSFAVQIEQNGCIDTSACYELLLTNLEELINSKKTIKIFPNPIRKEFYLEGINQNTEISIYDTSGKIVKRLFYKNNGYDISELKTGTYYVFIKNNEETIIKKVIKN